MCKIITILQLVSHINDVYIIKIFNNIKNNYCNSNRNIIIYKQCSIYSKRAQNNRILCYF